MVGKVRRGNNPASESIISKSVSGDKADEVDDEAIFRGVSMVPLQCPYSLEIL